MRLWTLHPRYLDRQGLTGGWREALLAQAVLAGRTKGYRSHPQLERFLEHPDPAAAIGVFLAGIVDEAVARGYSFDRSKIDHDPATEARARVAGPIPATEGQRDYEWHHLRAKLAARNPEWAAQWEGVEVPDVHPMFTVEPGPLANWERPDGPGARA